MKSPEQPESSIVNIRQSIEALKRRVEESKKKKEVEAEAVAREIVAMAEGNRRLESEIKKSRSLSAYDKTLETLNDSIKEKEGELNDLKIQNESNLLEIVELEKQAEDLPKEEGEKVLSQLSLLKEETQKIFNGERAKLAEVIEQLKKEYDKFERKYQEYYDEQTEIALDPYKFAKEQVLKATGLKSVDGNDGIIGLSKEKERDIDDAVYAERYDQGTLEDIKTKILGIEIYIEQARRNFNDYEETLKKAGEGFDQNLKGIEDDLQKGGSIKVQVDKYVEKINKQEKRGFFSRMIGSLPENEVSNQRTNLRALRAQIRGDIDQFVTNCNTRITEIYNTVGSGVYCEENLLDHSSMHTLKAWKKRAEDNPETFKDVKDKIDSLYATAERLVSKRKEILALYEQINKGLRRKAEDLKTKVNSLFTNSDVDIDSGF